MGTLYTPFKTFHYQDKLDSLPKNNNEIQAPVHIRIKPTNVCNHDCWYCAYRVSNLQLGKDMVIKDFIPKEKMMEIIDDCIEMNVKAITFSGGGEPFVYKYLLDTVKKLSDSEIKFASLSNGSRLKGEIAEIFSHHATWLRISIDGYDNESYMAYRNTRKDEYSKVINNLENFKKIGGPCVLGISFVVDKDNYQHIFESAKIMKDLGANSIKILACLVSNDGNENDKYHAPFYQEAKAQAVQVKEELEDEGFEVNDHYHDAEVDFSKDYDWCPYTQLLPVIGADCKVYPCHDKAYNNEAILGDISNTRFKDFWFANKETFFKINPSKMCLHHCLANTRNKMILEYLSADKKHLGFV